MKKILKNTIVPMATAAILAGGFSPAKAGENELVEQLPTFVDDAFKTLGLHHGAGIAVIKGDRIVFKGGFGFADVKAGIEATEDTSFYIASSTKSFTGLAALSLAAKGKLDLDKSLAAWFPEVEFDPALKAEKITIRHLLSHTHGIENQPIWYSVAYTGHHTPEWNLERLKQTQANEKAPLGTYDYSNLGYNIFSMILEREFDKPWQDILADEIFNPADMVRTSAYMTEAETKNWQVAQPYGFGVEDPTEPLYLKKKDNTMHAAGGMISSASDIARFLQAQLNEGRIDGKQVFPAKIIEEAHKGLASYEEKRGPLVRTGYSMGWILGSFEGDRFTHHFGGFAGTSAHVSFLPDHDIGIVILMNEGQASQPLSRLIAGYAFDLLRDKENTETTRRKALEELAESANGHRVRIQGHYAKLAEREWDMTRDLADYAGTYSNPQYGSMSVKTSINPHTLKVTFGNMKATATPYKETDSIRLELVPGRGAGMRFIVSDNGVSGLTYEGATFLRD